MGFTDNGIENVQLLIRGAGTLLPTHIVYGTDTDDKDLSTDTIDNPVFITQLSWEKSGSNSKYTAEISSLEAVGDDLNISALYDADTIGEGTEWTLDDSVIKTKTNDFNVQIQGEIIIQRP